MKKVILVHGWLPRPVENWFPWLAGELQKSGVHVQELKMPSPAHPVRREWVNAINEAVGEPNRETFLVGYSLGAFATLSYLGQAEGSVGGTVLVGGIVKLRLLHSFLTTFRYRAIPKFLSVEPDWEKAKKNCGRVKLFHGHNDPTVLIQNGYYISARMGAPLHVVEGGGHLGERAGYKEFPLLLKAVNDMVKGG